MLSRATLAIAAAGAGLCFIGYCVYFDRKRRSDPDFKKKLQERRKNASLNKSKSGATHLPDLSNPEEMQRFFLQEIQKGEELLATGEIDEGVEHLSNAVAVCGQPRQLMQVLQQTLPPGVYELLIQKLPSVGSRLAGAASAAAGGEGKPSATPSTESGVVIDETVD